MNRLCKCGGRLTPNGSDREYARFVCDRCGDTRQQKKRQPRSIMTRTDIEEQIYGDLCHRTYPLVTREGAIRHIEKHKPIVKRVNKLEATRLYDEVLLRYAAMLPSDVKPHGLESL